MRWLALLGLVAGCDYVLGLDPRPDGAVDVSGPDRLDGSIPQACGGYVQTMSGRYRLVMSAEIFTSAQRICAADGAHLAVTPTTEEVDAIRALARDAGYEGELWVGLTNSRHPTELADPYGFEWITEEPAAVPKRGVEPWASGEPANPESAHCASMRANVSLLDDQGCGTRRYFVCECDAFAVKPGF